LYCDDNGHPILIGWWPKTLFNNTFDYATKIAWAAGVFYLKNETSPPMGSGHAACEGANKAAYISNIKIFDQFGQTTDPDAYMVKELTD
jgi:Neprosin